MRNDAAAAQPLELLARAADSFQPLFLLATRWYVPFLKSGWLKATSWQSTLDLFPGKYYAPLLSHHAATVAGAFGELFSPVLLVLGLGGRLNPIGLFAVNLVAVISYSQVLLAEGFGAALA
jgi:putative oxidoreductase